MNKLIEQIDKLINKKGSLKTPAYYIRGLFIDIVNYFESKINKVVDNFNNELNKISNIITISIENYDQLENTVDLLTLSSSEIKKMFGSDLETFFNKIKKLNATGLIFKLKHSMAGTNIIYGGSIGFIAGSQVLIGVSQTGFGNGFTIAISKLNDNTITATLDITKIE